MNVRVRIGLLLLLTGLWVAGCTSDPVAGQSADQVEAADVESADVVDGADLEQSAPLQPVVSEISQSDVQAAVDVYERFLAARDEAYFVPDGDLSAFDSIAGESMLEEVRKFWARNAVFTDSGAGILGRSSTANIVETSTEAGQVKILDCVEVREDNEDESFSPVRFVEHEATVVSADDGWMVDAIRVIRSGDLADTDWFGCVPTYHEERVKATVEALAAEVFEWKSDPDPTVGTDVSEFFDGRLRQESEDALAQQREQFGNRYMSGVEEQYVTVAGSDIATGGWNFLVELCLYYPSGEIWTDVASGAEVVQKPPGSATRVGYRVRSDEVSADSWSDAIVDLTPVEYPSPCFDEL